MAKIIVAKIFIGVCLIEFPQFGQTGAFFEQELLQSGQLIKLLFIPSILCFCQIGT